MYIVKVDRKGSLDWLPYVCVIITRSILLNTVANRAATWLYKFPYSIDHIIIRFAEATTSTALAAYSLSGWSLNLFLFGTWLLIAHYCSA